MQELTFILHQIFDYYSQIEQSVDPLTMRAFISIFAITIYAIFAGSFYETLSKRMIFKINLTKPKLFAQEETHVSLWDFIVLFFKYTLFFPIITLIWTIALTLFLLVLSTSNPAEVAIISLSIVAATRIVAYYDEHIAVDVAKLLPIALLAMIVANPASLSADTLYSKSSVLFSQAPDFVPLFLFLVSIEWTLRILLELKYFLFGRPDEEQTDLDKLLVHYKRPKKD